MKKFFQFGLLALFLCSGSLADAHSLWFNMDGHGYGVNEPVKIELGWGHQFPQGTEIKDGMLNEVFALAPDGKKIPLKAGFKNRIRICAARKGRLCDFRKRSPRICEQNHPGV